MATGNLQWPTMSNGESNYTRDQVKQLLKQPNKLRCAVPPTLSAAVFMMHSVLSKPPSLNSLQARLKSDDALSKSIRQMRTEVLAPSTSAHFIYTRANATQGVFAQPLQMQASSPLVSCTCQSS
jgi:hypothetical protein